MTSLALLLMEDPLPADAPLLYGPDSTLTVEETRTAGRTVATALMRAEVRHGQAVAVQMRDGPQLIATMFGIWFAAAVFVPVNPRAPASEVAKVLASTGAAVLITGDEPEGLTVLPGPHRTYAIDTAFVMWTSGTTGEPKAILHTHSAYFELLDRVLGPLRAKPRDPARPPSPNLIAVSLSLNAGIYNVLFGLRAGAPIVVMDGFEPEKFAAAVARFEIRSTVLPPAAMAMLSDSPVTDLSPLRYVRSITAPLSPIQAKRFAHKFGVTVLNGYGQAEIGEVIGWTAADAKEHPEKIGAIGRPHPGVAIKLLDDSGAVVAAPDVVGQLWVRPPSMAAGYADGAELSDRVDADGFLDTGDLARMDPDGFVWIEGRVGDVINRGGNKVFPDHVEEALRLAPGVEAAGVVGVPDDRLGSVPVAFVVVSHAVSDDELRAVCREHLAPYKVPVAFHRVEALPRNEVGKLLRKDLVALYAELEDTGS